MPPIAPSAPADEPRVRGAKSADREGGRRRDFTLERTSPIVRDGEHETVKHMTRRTLGVLLIAVGVAALAPTVTALFQTTPIGVHVPLTLWLASVSHSTALVLLLPDRFGGFRRFMVWWIAIAGPIALVAAVRTTATLAELS
jgi:hypothetical protein